MGEFLRKLVYKAWELDICCALSQVLRFRVALLVNQMLQLFSSALGIQNTVYSTSYIFLHISELRRQLQNTKGKEALLYKKNLVRRKDVSSLKQATADKRPLG